MKLTGKCKEDFEKWYNKDIPKEQDGWTNIERNSRLLEFYHLSESMQYGVYVDFFDNVGLSININFYGNENDWQYDLTNSPEMYNCDSRQEARTKAIEKANEIYNKLKY